MPWSVNHVRRQSTCMDTWINLAALALASLRCHRPIQQVSANFVSCFVGHPETSRIEDVSQFIVQILTQQSIVGRLGPQYQSVVIGPHDTGSSPTLLTMLILSSLPPPCSHWRHGWSWRFPALKRPGPGTLTSMDPLPSSGHNSIKPGCCDVVV